LEQTSVRKPLEWTANAEGTTWSHPMRVRITPGNCKIAGRLIGRTMDVSSKMVAVLFLVFGANAAVNYICCGFESRQLREFLDAVAQLVERLFRQ
jgi:hypothetical protein